MGVTAQQLLRENQRRISGHRSNSKSVRKYRIANDLTKNYVVLFLETTGLRPGADQIIQIGAIKYENDQVVATYRTLINPGRYIPIEVTRQTKITNFLVEDAPYIEDKIEELLLFIDGLPIVMHNARIYMNFLYATEQIKAINVPYLTVIDTTRLARKTLPVLSPEKLAELTTYLQFQNEEQDILQNCNMVNNIYQLCANQLCRATSH